jgi:hypothetical protein
LASIQAERLDGRQVDINNMSEATSSIINSFHNDLKIAKEGVYDKCGFILTNLRLDVESKAYEACSFQLNGKFVQYRVAKITPTKTGQFVTIWKRSSDGITEPFCVSDNIDFIIISARSAGNFGQFIFPKSVLADKGIITQNGKAGKREIRVYPPWEITINKRARQTQAWQMQYFLTIGRDDPIDLDLINRLFV